jgi:cardiolipin synthase
MLWKSETLLFDGDEYFQCLFEEWARAERTIDFETYIFDDDNHRRRGRKRASIGFASRGVRVRLLVDGIGARRLVADSRCGAREKFGAEVRVYHPLMVTQLWRRLMIDLRLIVPERKPKRSLVLRRLNRRNHRKVSVDRRAELHSWGL